MSKKRRIQTKFRSDPYIQDLDTDSKLLYIYLFTNEHTNIAGIYEISLRTISFESGISLKKVSEILGSLQNDKKAYYSG